MSGRTERSLRSHGSGALKWKLYFPQSVNVNIVSLRSEVQRLATKKSRSTCRSTNEPNGRCTQIWATAHKRYSRLELMSDRFSFDIAGLEPLQRLVSKFVPSQVSFSTGIGFLRCIRRYQDLGPGGIYMMFSALVCQFQNSICGRV